MVAPLVDVHELVTRLDDPAWVLVDCRFRLDDPTAGARAFEAGHIPGAYYARLDRDLAGPPGVGTGRHPLPEPEALARRLGAWGVGPGRIVVAYDDAGGAVAARLWWLLRWLGHDAAAVLDGGYPAWTAAGLPVTRELAPPEPAAFSPRPDPDRWVAVERLEAALAAGRVVLLDARDPERFRGEREPFDPVAGHVPGAINVPYAGNLGPDGRLLSPESLRERFSRALGGRPAGDAVVMCGSGVTACHDLLAMEVAGLPGARLYPGSWSEWVAGAERPVARGP
ncbi:MAG: sulfurtransferase [Gammaproteobacteria bacterium]|nr:sulfurtransferase [Gammaproteobacteria bacterium]NIR82171.1 sulfurtransferase [Gammaproteobacteria bacterium]NIU03324.1 sulfurtransferase [Gammaproteobacteria bacterium]NIW74365.1 sulfurtransferase [Gemmatimonadota bacterium]NIX84599.1 sulfurtransferase [Gammaproteobacteria bacterium]